MWRNFNPWTEMYRLRRELDRLAGDWGEGVRRFGAAFLPGLSGRGYPLINMYETADAIHVHALAPGLDTEKIEVSIEGNQLTISGEKKALEEAQPADYHRNERATGRFSRVIELRCELDPDNIDASYVDGILRIALPKHERARPKQVQVQVK